MQITEVRKAFIQNAHRRNQKKFKKNRKLIINVTYYNE